MLQRSKMPSYDQAIGSIIAGKYRVVGTLGQGGMGSVYEAINDAVGKRVAIKLLDASLADHPEFARRFELEAKAAALIDHPGMVDVLDMGQTERWRTPRRRCCSRPPRQPRRRS